jgi:hypothetical protein
MKAKSLRLGVFAALFLAFGCSKAVVVPLRSPFPPASRWEKALDSPLSGALATDGTLVFAGLSTGPVLAIDPATGSTLWTRAGVNPGLVAARPGLLVFAEKGGVVWGLRTEDGNAAWKTTINVREVASIRLDGNRVFLGGATGIAALMVSTGEMQFDLEAVNVRDIDVASDRLAAIENGALVVRNRENGVIRFSLDSPEGEFGAPALFADGRVVLGSGARLVRAVSSSGEFKWRFKVGARARDRPLDFLDGERVGVLSFEGVFYELSLGGGDMRRRVLLSSRPFGPPILRSERIWAPVFEDELAVIDPKAAKVIGRTRFGGGFLSAPLLVGGRVLAEVSGPRRIVALETVPLG